MELGAKGMAWFLVTSDGIKSPTVKFFSEEELAQIQLLMAAKPGDLLVFIADSAAKAAPFWGACGFIWPKSSTDPRGGEKRFLWVVDFPSWLLTMKRAAILPTTTPLPRRWKRTCPCLKKTRQRCGPEPMTWS
jgi:aspartyl-tRNA synthetase